MTKSVKKLAAERKISRNAKTVEGRVKNLSDSALEAADRFKGVRIVPGPKSAKSPLADKIKKAVRAYYLD